MAFDKIPKSEFVDSDDKSPLGGLLGLYYMGVAWESRRCDFQCDILILTLCKNDWKNELEKLVNNGQHPCF